MGLIPGWKTKIPHATWCCQKNFFLVVLCEKQYTGLWEIKEVRVDPWAQEDYHPTKETRYSHTYSFKIPVPALHCCETESLRSGSPQSSRMINGLFLHLTCVGPVSPKTNKAWSLAQCDCNQVLRLMNRWWWGVRYLLLWQYSLTGTFLYGCSVRLAVS